MATADAVSVPVHVTVDECVRKHRASTAITSIVVAALSALIAVVVATAAVGWGASTQTAVQRAELENVIERLDRIEAKLDALARP